MRAVFIDATESLAVVAERLHRPGDPPLTINRQPNVVPETLPALLDGAEITWNDHTLFPANIARQCRGLRHVVFLGTGPQSYMNLEELAALGITVHIIKGYGDTAVAEHTVALMFAAAKNLAAMDREMRAGIWLRSQGAQLTGKTLGLIGFGGIAAEVARIAGGMGMRVIAWNRTAKLEAGAGIGFVPLDVLLAESHVVSLHLALSDETRGILSRERMAAMRPGAIVVNTARGALIDEDALIEALRSGHIRHAALDVFAVEPLPEDHAFLTLPNVTLSAHSAFRTPEASDNLIEAALEHCRRIAREGR